MNALCCIIYNIIIHKIGDSKIPIMYTPIYIYYLLQLIHFESYNSSLQLVNMDTDLSRSRLIFSG